MPSAAIIREVYEETGLEVVPARITGIYVTDACAHSNGDRAQYVVTTFECEPAGAECPRAADDEHLDVDYFPLEALPDISPQHRQRIEHAVGQHPAAYFRAAGA